MHFHKYFAIKNLRSVIYIYYTYVERNKIILVRDINCHHINDVVLLECQAGFHGAVGHSSCAREIRGSISSGDIKFVTVVG